MSPALLAGVGCFLGTLGVAMFVTRMAWWQNEKDAARAWATATRIQRRLDEERNLPRWTEENAVDYGVLRGMAALMDGKPFDQQHPLNARLSETAARVEPASGGRPTLLAPVDAAAVSLSRATGESR